MRMKKIFFVAGGTGITPCYQTIREIINMKEETIELTLLFCNKSEEDILLRKEIDCLAPRVKVYYMIDKAGEKWNGYTGYVNEKILSEICPLDEPETIYIHCGPGPMNKVIRELFIEKYPNSKWFKY